MVQDAPALASSPVLVGYSLVGVYPCAVWKPRRDSSASTIINSAPVTTTAATTATAANNIPCSTSIATTNPSCNVSGNGTIFRRQCDECRPGAPVRTSRVTTTVRTAPYPQPQYSAIHLQQQQQQVHQHQHQLQHQHQHHHHQQQRVLVAGVSANQIRQPLIDTSLQHCHCRTSAVQEISQVQPQHHAHYLAPQQLQQQAAQHQCGIIGTRGDCTGNSVGLSVAVPVSVPVAPVAPPVQVAALPVAVAASNTATPMLFVPFSVPSFAPPMTGATLQNTNNCSPSGGSAVKVFNLNNIS